MKIADSAAPRPMNPRHLTAAVLVAILVGTLAAWVSCLGIYYHFGADSAKLDVWRTGQGHYGFEELQGWLNTPHPVDSGRISASAVGLVIVILLGFLRTRFTWWPLHPIGYAVGSTDTMTWIWFPVLLGWLFKSLICVTRGQDVPPGPAVLHRPSARRLRHLRPLGALFPRQRPRRLPHVSN